MWILLIDLAISLAMIPLLFAVGYALSLAVEIVFNLFPNDGQDGGRTGDPYSLSGLADMAFALNLLMSVLWLLFFGILCAGRFSPQVKARLSPQVNARLPDSASGLLLHAFLDVWKMVGILLGFCIVVGVVYCSVRAVARLARQAAHRS